MWHDVFKFWTLPSDYDDINFGLSHKAIQKTNNSHTYFRRAFLCLPFLELESYNHCCCCMAITDKDSIKKNTFVLDKNNNKIQVWNGMRVKKTRQEFNIYLHSGKVGQSSGRWSCIQLFCSLSGTGRYRNGLEHLHSHWTAPDCQQCLKMWAEKSD